MQEKSENNIFFSHFLLASSEKTNLTAAAFAKIALIPNGDMFEAVKHAQSDTKRFDETGKPLMVNISAKMDNYVRPKNFDYSVLSSIYHELGIHTFLINHQRHSKETYDVNAIQT